MRRPSTWSLRAAVAAAVCVLYTAAVVAGLRMHDVRWMLHWPAQDAAKPWRAPRTSEMPDELTRLGARIFNETPLYAADHAHAQLSCASCHLAGGMQPFASPVTGMDKVYPKFSDRAGRIISINDRVEECFVRSENGTPIADDGQEMKAVLAYIRWVGRPQPGNAPLGGKGLMAMHDLNPDPAHGAEVYGQHCAGCHGDHGQGDRYKYPPLWGDDSFNDGAGMNTVPKMAAFVQHNMPQNRPGILSPQDAYDVAGFIHTKPRPKFDKQYASY